MGVNLKYGTAGATGGGYAGQPGSLQAAFDESRHEPRWSWQQRSPKTWRDKNRWYSLWSFGCRVGAGSPIGSDGAGWYDLSMRDLFEPYSCDGEGTQSCRFIKGITKNSSGTPISGVIVQAFRTSDDYYMGAVESREDGSYDCPTCSPAGIQHYLVAYKAGSPDIAGTTVNTLTPTNVDGT
jgi:hypothetical protein